LDSEQLQQLLRTRHNLRVGPNMAAYLLAKLGSAKKPKAIKVLAADARTGAPMPHQIDPAALAGDGEQMSLFQA
jgi:hypothetical protein